DGPVHESVSHPQLGGPPRWRQEHRIRLRALEPPLRAPALLASRAVLANLVPHERGVVHGPVRRRGDGPGIHQVAEQWQGGSADGGEPRDGATQRVEYADEWSGIRLGAGEVG